MRELAEDRSKLKMEAHWHQALISAASTHPPFVPSSKTVRRWRRSWAWVPRLVAGALSRLLLGACG